MFIYEFDFSVDAGKLAPHVGEILDSVNDNLATFGIAGKLAVRVPTGTLKAESDTELSAQEVAMMRDKLVQLMRDKFPQYDFACDGFRSKARESRNQPQSR